MKVTEEKLFLTFDNKPFIMKSLLLLLFSLFLISGQSPVEQDARKKIIIVWQPSHQTDTGKDFSEAATCNAIIEAAMNLKPHLKEFKVWSRETTDFHHAESGSNTKIEHTTAIIDGKISVYAYELEQSNKKHP